MNSNLSWTVVPLEGEGVVVDEVLLSLTNTGEGENVYNNQFLVQNNFY